METAIQKRYSLLKTTACGQIQFQNNGADLARHCRCGNKVLMTHEQFERAIQSLLSLAWSVRYWDGSGVSLFRLSVWRDWWLYNLLSSKVKSTSKYIFRSHYHQLIQRWQHHLTIRYSLNREQPILSDTISLSNAISNPYGVQASEFSSTSLSLQTSTPFSIL